MPIYEYECLKCHKVEEILQRFSDKPLTKCKHCSGKLHKLISHNSFHLKGTGWYVTDYAGKSQGPATDTKEPKKTPTSESKTAKSETKKTKESAD
jgi:putative FmdB family regulatory protein